MLTAYLEPLDSPETRWLRLSGDSDAAARRDHAAGWPPERRAAFGHELGQHDRRARGGRPRRASTGAVCRSAWSSRRARGRTAICWPSPTRGSRPRARGSPPTLVEHGLLAEGAVAYAPPAATMRRRPRMAVQRTRLSSLVTIAALIAGTCLVVANAQSRQPAPGGVPQFEADPGWPNPRRLAVGTGDRHLRRREGPRVDVEPRPHLRMGSAGQAAAVVGRARARRQVEHHPRPVRGSQRFRVDQRAREQSDGQVHAHRTGRAGDRPLRSDRRQQRHQPDGTAVGDLGRSRRQRSVRRGRLRQSPRHRVRRRDRKVPSALGRVREAACGSAARFRGFQQCHRFHGRDSSN